MEVLGMRCCNRINMSNKRERFGEKINEVRNRLLMWRSSDQFFTSIVQTEQSALWTEFNAMAERSPWTRWTELQPFRVKLVFSLDSFFSSSTLTPYENLLDSKHPRALKEISYQFCWILNKQRKFESKKNLRKINARPPTFIYRPSNTS